jgi:hypothetical protein
MSSTKRFSMGILKKRSAAISTRFESPWRVDSFIFSQFKLSRAIAIVLRRRVIAELSARHHRHGSLNSYFIAVSPLFYATVLSLENCKRAQTRSHFRTCQIVLFIKAFPQLWRARPAFLFLLRASSFYRLAHGGKT